MSDTVSINTLEFAGARAQEIACMEQVLTMGNRDRAQRVFQRLPRHMRRRQMSHNVKRLPRNMRDQARSEMESQGLSKTDGAPKRPSRFYRRRPRRLEEAYAKRQKRVRWLETHIWYAKRFHMVEKWGYRLADRPTDKGVRAAYRYASRYASLTDLSYYQHLEIKGEKQQITRLFHRLGQANVGSRIGAGRFVTGAMRGRTILFEPDVVNDDDDDKTDRGDSTSEKGRVMCDVAFLWRPTPSVDEDSSINGDSPNSNSTTTRTLWIWVHPLSLTRLFSILQAENARLALGCTIIDISGQIVRFRVFGPRSIDVLNAALKTVTDVDVGKPGENAAATPFSHPPLHQKLASQKIAKIDEKYSTWFRDSLDASPSAREVHQLQSRRWSSLPFLVGSPHELPRDVVMGLTVEDPRLSRPCRKTIPKPQLVEEEMEDVISYDAHLADSPLWRPDVRRQVKDRKLTIADMYILRSSNMVPGTPLQLGKYTSHLPIIICQYPGGKGAGGGSSVGSDQPSCWASGIDLFLPESWGKDFWLSLVYNGGRAGGLQEVAAVDFENARLTFPRFFPDSVDGESEAKIAQVAAVESYFARPIAKRVNFLNMGTLFPFRSPWKALVKEWREEIDEDRDSNTSEDGGAFQVLRDGAVLKNLDAAIRNHPGQESLHALESLLPRLVNCLVPLRVTCDARGTITPRSQLCAPSREDIINNIQQSGRMATKSTKWKAPVDVWTPPEEPCHWVSDERHDLLKNAVKKARREMGVARFPIDVDQPDNVISVCSRLTMGFVVDGRLALTLGKPRGVGFVAGSSLLRLLKTFSSALIAGQESNNNDVGVKARITKDDVANKLFLLCRCPNSRRYRKVGFEILY